MHFKPYRTCIGSLVVVLMAGDAAPSRMRRGSFINTPQIFFTSDTGYMDHDTSLAVGDVSGLASVQLQVEQYHIFPVSFDNGTGRSCSTAASITLI